MTRTLHRTFFLRSPAGRLEALLWTVPAADPSMAAVVAHPHPLHGGTLHNKVVFHAARTLNRLGLPVLRFNFRGAGLSEGEHDHGQGEADDVCAAVDWLAAEYPGKSLLLAGFSFGAWVGLRVGCRDARVSHLVGLGIPVNASRLDYLRECPKPKLFLHGSADEHGDHAKVRELFEAMPQPKRLVFIEGADHFFTGKLNELRAALESWARGILA